MGKHFARYVQNMVDMYPSCCGQHEPMIWNTCIGRLIKNLNVMACSASLLDIEMGSSSTGCKDELPSVPGIRIVIRINMLTAARHTQS